ncbi:dihydrofolate reductase family protein [Streptomyces sp. NPDC000410]|uniref:dihydrofolate reductase family protein n=1 Tax=Streptomyces sp. NPDC000410 TaxID=3154254 RepID=UPI00331AA9C5
MRKLFLQINMSLDGFIEDVSGEIDWHFADREFDEFILETLRSIDAMIFGRVAYQKLAEYWPTAATGPDASELDIEVARLVNGLPKYVVSHHLAHADWNNSHIIRGDVAERIGQLKQQPGQDIALFAGAGAATTFTRLGLIDEYRIIVNPALLGAGTPLFKGGYRRTELKLLRTRPFKNGSVVLYYAPVQVG